MDDSIKVDFYKWIVVAIIFFISIAMQKHMFLTWDVCWLLEDTQRLLAGGDYYHTFVENNPPMILFIYTIPVLISKWLQSSVIWIFRCYIYLIALVSILFCNFLINKILRPSDWLRQWLFMLTLAIVYLILPTNDFGQREHIIVMLTLPYFLLMSSRFDTFYVTREYNIRIITLIIIGVLAGIGFAIKPYFIFALIFTEIALMVKKRNLLALMRVELISIILVILIYLISIFVITPDYMTKILPMVASLYVNYRLDTWETLFLNAISIATICSILLGCIFLHRATYQGLIIILLLSLIGFFIAFLLQGKYWYYHMLPMFSLAIILAVIILPELTKMENILCQVVSILLISIVLLIPLLVIENRVATFATLYSSRDNETNQLIEYSKQNAGGGSIYLISTTAPPGAILPVYANVASASRFPDIWILPGIFRLWEKSDPKSHAKAEQYTRFLLNAVVEDFEKNKPTLVFVDMEKKKKFMENVKVDFIPLFMQDARFREIWKNYKYQKMIGRFAVYKRIQQ